MTMPDPEEEPNTHGAWPHTQRIIPPVPWAQTCNIVYPRDLLERIGGFLDDPPLSMGEDTELALRGRKAGRAVRRRARGADLARRRGPVAAPRLRTLPRWADVAALINLHPEIRDDFPMWGFWKRTPRVAAGRGRGRCAVAAQPGLAGAGAALGGAPAPAYGEGNPRGRMRAASELPLRALIDAAEMPRSAPAGALKHRTLFL